MGLLRADAGTAEVLGGDPWHDAVSLHRRLAYVPGEVTLPGASFDLFPLVGLTFVASVLIAVGLALFARRERVGLVLYSTIIAVTIPNIPSGPSA